MQRSIDSSTLQSLPRRSNCNSSNRYLNLDARNVRQIPNPNQNAADPNRARSGGYLCAKYLSVRITTNYLETAFTRMEWIHVWNYSKEFGGSVWIGRSAYIGRGRPTDNFEYGSNMFNRLILIPRGDVGVADGRNS
jgi:hypothetical protein